MRTFALLAGAAALAAPAAATAAKPKPLPLGGKVWVGAVATGTYSSDGTGGICGSPFHERTSGLRLVTASRRSLNLTFRYEDTPPSPARSVASGSWTLDQTLLGFCDENDDGSPRPPVHCGGPIVLHPSSFGVGTLARTTGGKVLIRVVGGNPGEAVPTSGPCSEQGEGDLLGFGASFGLWEVVQARFSLARVRRWLVARHPAPLVAAAEQWDPPDPGSSLCDPNTPKCTATVTARATIVVSRTPLPANWADAYH